LKILIISYNIPYPLNNGGAIAQFFFFEKYIGVQYTFLTKCNNSIEYQRIKQLSKYCPHIDIVVFKNYNGIHSIIDKVRFVFNYFPGLKKIIIKYFIRDKKNDLNNSDFKFISFIQDYLDNYNIYDWLQFEFFESIGLINKLKFSAKSIAIVHEIRTKRLEFEKKLKQNVINEIKEFEFEVLKKFSKIVVFNSEDKLYIQNILKCSQILISPFSIPDSLIKIDGPPSKIEKLVFIGSQFHEPNKDGLENFIDNIYIYYKLSEYVDLVIAGEWDYDFQIKYSNFKKIKFIGRVKDLSTYLFNSCLICPILSGSGIRTKILECFFNNVPVISTPIGAEGLYSLCDDNHIFIYNDNLEFVRLFDKIYNMNAQDLKQFCFQTKSYINDKFNSNNIINKRLVCYE
jgi:hypothetical protein